MTDETVDQPTAEEAKLAVLQAVVDRVTSWQESADEPTVRKELDEALAKSDIEVGDDVRQRIVDHILEDPEHVDVHQFL